MVQFVSDVGSKYKQAVTPDTPSYAATGVRMEDSFCAFRGDGDLLLVVADGHGSTKVSDGVVVGGRECADAACEAVRTASSHRDPIALFSKSQRAIRDKVVVPGQQRSAPDGVVRVRASSGDVELSVRGTTLSVCRVCPGRDSWFAWVGDSVGLLVRGDAVVVPLGTPHGTQNKAEALRVARLGGKVDGKYFEFRTAGSKQRIMLSRALGHVGHDPISKTPEVVHFVPYAGDKLVVATDGLWDCISVARAGQVVAAAATEADACAALLEAYHASKHPRDNVAIACHFVGGGEKGGCACAVQ
jgi:serine/threonine protein phosphatase PrpC